MSAADHPWKLIGALVVTAVGSGFLLALVFNWTAPAIEAHRQEAMRRAVLNVVDQAETFEAVVWVEGAWEVVPLDYNGGTRLCYRGLDSTQTVVGYAFAAQGPGFMDTIKLIYGFNPSSRTVTGMEVLDSRETPGLGDKIAKDHAFLQSFKKLSIDPRIIAAAKPSSANEVDAISGATISSEAVVSIVNQDLQWVRDRFEEPHP
ncbi:MAG: RnfABCDGE type electron transport complex subunit G [Acidobacteria bacterium]|nr:RnfABCDGE type electron transport complex subunit G [Acidobacteriota bacterium]